MRYELLADEGFARMVKKDVTSSVDRYGYSAGTSSLPYLPAASLIAIDSFNCD
jgi:hypothetical protein